MPELRAKIENNNLIPYQACDNEVLNSLKPNMVYKVKFVSPRSNRHQGLFFAAIKSAFDNWPENHEFKPENEEHLRQFLEIKAGYRTALTVSLDTSEHKQGFFAALTGAIAHAQAQGSKDSQKYVFIMSTAEKVFVVYANSISYSKLDQSEFNNVSNKVSDVLKEHTGLSLDDFKMGYGDCKL